MFRRPRPARPPADDASRAAGAARVRMIGYVSAALGEPGRIALGAQAALVTACESRGLELVGVVREAGAAPASGDRIELGHVLERIRGGEAAGLVAARLEHVATSLAELGLLVEWLGEQRARLIVLDSDLDTEAADGRLLATLVTRLGEQERDIAVAQVRRRHARRA